jgi:hypothetical protein
MVGGEKHPSPDAIYYILSSACDFQGQFGSAPPQEPITQPLLPLTSQSTALGTRGVRIQNSQLRQPPSPQEGDEDEAKAGFAEINLLSPEAAQDIREIWAHIAADSEQQGSAESRFPETLRLFLQIGPGSSAGSSIRSLARVRFGRKVVLGPPVQSCTPDQCRSSARMTSGAGARASLAGPKRTLCLLTGGSR